MSPPPILGNNYSELIKFVHFILWYYMDCNLIEVSDRPGVEFQPGPGSNFLAGAGAGGTDCGRGR